MKVHFSIFKNDYKEKDNQPDYTILYSEKDQETGEYGKSKKVGGCWLKKTAKGDSFFSCQYDDEYTPPADADKQFNDLTSKEDEIKASDIPFN